MQSIWKYEIPEDVEFTIDIPGAYSPLKVDIQGGKECFWVMIYDTEVEVITRHFLSIGTGWDIDILAKGRQIFYIGSIIRPDGLVKHIWAVEPGKVEVA